MFDCTIHIRAMRNGAGSMFLEIAKHIGVEAAVGDILELFNFGNV